MRTRGKVFLSFCISILVLVVGVFGFGIEMNFDVFAKTLRELNREVEVSKQKIDNFSSKMSEYQAKINETSLKINSLEDELNNLSQNIENTDSVIKDAEYRINAKKKSIIKLSKDIVKNEMEIEKQKKILEEIVQEMYLSSEDGQIDLLELILYSGGFQEALNDVEYLDILHEQGEISIDNIESVKRIMRRKRETLEGETDNLNILLESLEKSRNILAEHEEAKEILLTETQGDEAKYIKLKQEMVLARKDLDEEITRIQNDIKKEKERLSKLKKLNLKDSSLIWPVDNPRITTYFKDPNYPFIHLLGQHMGIDLAAPLGTALKAAHGGIVTVGNMPKGYGKYVIITTLGQDGKMISTLYGHMNSIYVDSGEEVKAGQTIGEVGSTGFSTGPHTHFEVRVDGTPVNPLIYLP